MRVGIPGNLQDERAGSSIRYHNDAAQPTVAWQVEAFLQVGAMRHYRSVAHPVSRIYGDNHCFNVAQPHPMLCGHAHFFHNARAGQSTVSSRHQLQDESGLLDTTPGKLAAFPSGRLP